MVTTTLVLSKKSYLDNFARVLAGGHLPGLSTLIFSCLCPLSNRSMRFKVWSSSLRDRDEVSPSLGERDEASPLVWDRDEASPLTRDWDKASPSAGDWDKAYLLLGDQGEVSSSLEDKVPVNREPG